MSMKRFSILPRSDACEAKPPRVSAGGRSALFWSVALSLLAFAANSIFCRLALMGGDIDPHSFTAIRLLSGAVFLYVLLRSKTPKRAARGTWKGGLALFVYAYLFSIAYVDLGAGAGALILFGAVQVTMFIGSWCSGERVGARALTGMLIAFAGLITLLLPGSNAPAIGSVLLMLIAGVAWGTYSLIGKGAVDPLAATTGNFIRSVPLVVGLALLMILARTWHLNAAGVLYALAAGVLASGAGYAIWYGVIQHLPAHNAATLQLTVPVIAALGGVVFLAEPISARLAVTTAAVLGGVALACIQESRTEAD